MAGSDLDTPETRARQRAKDFTGLLWHAGAFLIVNTFLWIQDIASGDGLEYAYWATIPWALGLGFHTLAYLLGRGLEEASYEKFLEQERRRETQLH